MPTLFTKIINGEIPSYKIYEDELTFAFLDIKPHNLGHTLIVPKTEVGDYRDLPEPYYSAVFNNAKFLGRAIQQATNCERVGLVLHGMGVPDHLHVHLIPMFAVDDLNTTKAQERSEEEMQEVHRRIVDTLESSPASG
jgi:histidine triad (HIT) family protein